MHIPSRSALHVRILILLKGFICSQVFAVNYRSLILIHYQNSTLSKYTVVCLEMPKMQLYVRDFKTESHFEYITRVW